MASATLERTPGFEPPWTSFEEVWALVLSGWLGVACAACVFEGPQGRTKSNCLAMDRCRCCYANASDILSMADGGRDRGVNRFRWGHGCRKQQLGSICAAAAMRACVREKLHISTIGGSITGGQGAVDAPNWPQYVFNFLKDNYGDDNIVGEAALEARPGVGEGGGGRGRFGSHVWNARTPDGVHTISSPNRLAFHAHTPEPHQSHRPRPCTCPACQPCAFIRSTVHPVPLSNQPSTMCRSRERSHCRYAICLHERVPQHARAGRCRHCVCGVQVWSPSVEWGDAVRLRRGTALGCLDAG
eukprot:358723-Chlamydomonas_euryale.AAC.11